MIFGKKDLDSSGAEGIDRYQLPKLDELLLINCLVPLPVLLGSPNVTQLSFQLTRDVTTQMLKFYCMGVCKMDKLTSLSVLVDQNGKAIGPILEALIYQLLNNNNLNYLNLDVRFVARGGNHEQRYKVPKHIKALLLSAITAKRRLGYVEIKLNSMYIYKGRFGNVEEHSIRGDE